MELSFSKKQYEQGDKAQLQVHTKTKYGLPLAPIQAELNIHNYFCNAVEERPYCFASSNTMQTYAMELDFKECGKYEVQLHHLRAFDLLGLFSCKLKQTRKAECYCLPKPLSCAFDIPEVEGEETSYDPLKRGSDPSETVGVHSYQPGDSLHAIHWKLSAKTDTYMVREFASHNHQKAAICFSFYGSYLDAQTILSYVYGGSLTLLQAGSIHEIKQYENGLLIFRSMISSKVELDQAICYILDHPVQLGKQNDVPSANLAQSLLVDVQGISSVKKGGM